MRTFVSWRFWLTLLALAGLTYGLLQVTKDRDVAAEPSPAETRTGERRIDLVAPVFLIQADPGAAIVDGVTTGRIQIRVDGFRYMNIAPGTPGENRCPDTTELAKCVVVADLLGEAVLWFALLPAEPRNELTLPQIEELRDGSLALLSNGWLVRHAEVITRDCDDDVSSMAEFLRDHRDGSTSTFDLDDQEIVSVACAGVRPIVTTPHATLPPTNR
jgi:hypothetical protein